jgi:lysophospholipase L1-like esterase
MRCPAHAWICLTVVTFLGDVSGAGCPDLTVAARTSPPPGALRILVYGDSNSDNGHRYAGGDSIPDSTWAEHLCEHSGDYEVINESSAGETIRWIMDAANPYGSFDTKIENVLQRSGPVDLVLIQLGTNDARFAATADSPDDQT